MTFTKAPSLALIAWALTGCSTSGPIEVSGDPSAVPAFKTFRIYEEQYAFATDISDEQRAQVARELRKHVVSALNQRGYREAQDADVFVTLGAISRPTLNEDSESRGGALHPVDTSVLDAGQPTSVPESQFMPSGAGREGDLILYLLDPKTQKALWRASSSGSATTASEALRKARSTYGAMIAMLPKAAGGS